MAKPINYPSKPCRVYYSRRTLRPVTKETAAMIGCCATKESAQVTATDHIVHKRFARADIYGPGGHHLFSLIRHRFGVRIEQATLRVFGDVHRLRNVA